MNGCRSRTALAALGVVGVVACSCSRADRESSGAAGSRAMAVGSGELPVASADRPQQLATPWAVSAGPSAEPAPSASAVGSDAGVVEDKGPVRLGSMTVTGSLSKEVIGRTIRAQMPKFGQCWEKAAARSSGRKGRLEVRLAIDREGAVTTAGNGGSDLQDEELVGCVLRAFSWMKFPQPKDGIVLVVVPLKFGVQ